MSRVKTLAGNEISPCWWTAIAIQYMRPQKAMSPVSQPSPNARCVEVSLEASNKGTRQIQARAPKSKLGKLRISRIPDNIAAKIRHTMFRHYLIFEYFPML